MGIADYVNKRSNLAAAVTRILVRAASVATAFGLGCTAVAAHTFPPDPILWLMAQKQPSAAAPEAAHDDALAVPETQVEVEADEMCGYSILDGQPASVSNSTVAVGKLELEREKLQGSWSRVDGWPGLYIPSLHDSDVNSAPPAMGGENPAFHWNSAIRQSLLFLAISHAFRFTTEPSTRADMKGPFWRDYFCSVGNLRGWNDGDEVLVNYIGHPMEGAVSGFIQIQNDAKGITQEVGFNKDYWHSRLKAFGWAAAFSTQFEIGLVSEASLGNVGLKPSEKSNHPMGYVDLVVTPVLGTAWLVGEDLIDRYVIQRIESKVKNRLVRSIVRSILNPSRSFANMHRGQWFWYRDGRSLGEGL